MVPSSHPRYLSLKTRDLIVAGVERGVTSIHGLIAHGRGEAFDYLLGECTQDFAHRAIQAAAAMLLLARHPVLSINGNVCALVAPEMCDLAAAIPAQLEVNIFHTSPAREAAIRDMLEESGARQVLMPSQTHLLKHIDHNRKWIHPEGIFLADVVLVPLEDGDRCQALINNGKRVITVDLNPLSRTAKSASITIVDNVTRCIPLLSTAVAQLRSAGRSKWEQILLDYDNEVVLAQALAVIRGC